MSEKQNHIELNFILNNYINDKTHIIEFPDRIHTIKFATDLNDYAKSKKKDDSMTDIFDEEVKIDYKPLLEQEIKEEMKDAAIRTTIEGSDHCPVVLELD